MFLFTTARQYSDIYMLIISGCCKKKLQRRIKCVFKNCGYPESWRGGEAPPPRGVRGGPLPPLPSAGRGVVAINHVTDIGFHSVIWYPVRSKRSLREGQRSHPEEPPSGATLRSHLQEPPSGATLRSHPRVAPFILVPGWYQSGTRVVSEWYQGVKVTALY